MLYQLRAVPANESPTTAEYKVLLEELRRQRSASRRVEVALVLGSAAVSLAGFILSEAGYKKAAGALTIGSIIVGAALGAAKLASE